MSLTLQLHRPLPSASPALSSYTLFCFAVILFQRAPTCEPKHSSQVSHTCAATKTHAIHCILLPVARKHAGCQTMTFSALTFVVSFVTVPQSPHPTLSAARCSAWPPHVRHEPMNGISSLMSQTASARDPCSASPLQPNVASRLNS